MFKDKIIDLIHKEEDVIRHTLENFEELEALKEESMVSMSLEEREELALERQKAREKHDTEIEHKRELKKELAEKHKNGHLLEDDVLQKFLSTNKL